MGKRIAPVPKGLPGCAFDVAAPAAVSPSLAMLRFLKKLHPCPEEPVQVSDVSEDGVSRKGRPQWPGTRLVKPFGPNG